MRIELEHKMAAHCENGATSALLSFHGISLSEPMIFGIGSGCFFSYMPFYRLNGLPVISFRHWPGIIFRRCTHNLGITVGRMKFSNPEKAMAGLDALLGEGIPVGVLAGVFNLPYFPPEYRFHFNAHNLVVFGKEEERYLISDPVMEKVESLTYKELQKVRFARGTHPPKGRMYWIVDVPQSINLENAVRKGIKKNCSDMLRIPFPFFGTRGIRFIAQRMKSWDRRFGNNKATQYLGQFIRMLEEIGTGGGGFRFIYAAFLQEAASVLNMQNLRELSAEMTQIGDGWREFSSRAAKNLRDRGVPAASYTELAQIVHDLALREEKVFRDLDRLIK